MNKKRVLALMMSGMMLFSLAGCGSSSSTDSSAADSTPAAEETTEDAAEESTDKSPVLDTVADDESGTVSGDYTPEDGATIEVFTIKEEIVEVVDNIIKEFEAQYPQVKVNHTYGEDGETVLKTRLASNDIPDVMQVMPAGVEYKEYYDAGYVTDVTNEAFEQNIGQNLLDLTEYKDIQFCMPMTVSTYGVYYRKDLFEAAGITSAPTTFDEFKEDLQKLQDSGIKTPIAFPFKGDAPQLTERLMGELNPDCPNDFQAIADGTKDIADSETLNTFADFLDTIKPYATEDALGMDRDAALQDLVNGDSAIMFNGSWLLSQFLTANPDIDIAYCALPSPLLDSPKVAVNVDTAWSIGTSTKYPEACKAFLDFLSQTDIAQEYYEVDGNINYVKGVKYDKEQLMDVYNTVMSGAAFSTVGNQWPTWDLRADLAAAAQGYYGDGDREAFFDAAAEYIDFYYHR